MKTILYMAITPNGFVAGERDDTSWVSKSDWAVFLQAAKRAGNVVFGRRTFEVMLKEKLFPVPGCLNIVMTHQKKLLANAKWQNVTFTDESPRGVIEHLEEKGFGTALIGGGGKISASFMKENLIDELHLTVEPVVFGRGIKIFDDEPIVARLAFIELVQIAKNEVQLRYKVLKKK